ncbi:phosphotransferase enzyme family protein [Mycolicibacterium sp. F2034L]|uniref:phosphotransferase enzyme family protein n=1 Tax=Mycolicibacterium sp. F2034L TaxID=2926422 RepID=UPI001FF229CC|nr:phosphotransferase [Mycolicibacterium sp. F2034L]MCK0177175.1 phosphotransferase [Mycolicibacterium sp. F2034L]
MAEVIADDIHVAQQALADYDLAPSSTLRLLNLSENATYLVEDPDSDTRSILRVHRKNYHRRHEIESELDWLDALRTESDVTVPTVLPTRDGRRVVTVDDHGTERYVVHFDMVAGAEPDEGTVTVHDFYTLGCITAALHDHSRSWTRPATFGRFAWDWQNCLGDAPRWGRWHDAAGVGPDETHLLGRAQDLLHRRLVDYGNGPDRFGLVHADLRLANLLVDGSTITVIDFDDCGFGWFFYDFGTAVSFIEDDPALPEWQASWVEGYRSHRSDHGEMTSADEEMLASFVLLRRLLLLAWMGTHSHSKESQSKAVSFAAGSCALAERYLSTNGQRLA